MIDACAAIRAAREEPLFATAPEDAVAWLLVEHPGPWPARDIPPGVPPEAVEVWEAADALGVRCQWIRPLWDRRSSPATVFAVVTTPGAAKLEHATVADLRELRDLDVEALAAGRLPGFGTPSDERPVLVCTHGKRDACCARYGRPIAQRLADRLPWQVWEVSHIGGHKYSASVVTLPDGYYHGGVGAIDVDDLVAALAGQRVLPSRLRGRAGLPKAVQAAEHFVRTRFAVSEVDGLLPLAYETGEVERVELGLANGAVCAVEVRPRQIAAGPGSCGKAAGTTTTFDLVSLQLRAETIERAG